MRASISPILIDRKLKANMIFIECFALGAAFFIAAQDPNNSPAFLMPAMNAAAGSLQARKASALTSF